MSSPVNGTAIHSNANPSKKALPRYGAAPFFANGVGKI